MWKGFVPRSSPAEFFTILEVGKIENYDVSKSRLGRSHRGWMWAATTDESPATKVSASGASPCGASHGGLFISTNMAWR